MSTEPDNLVLTLLREIRVDVTELKVGQRDLKLAVDELRESMPYALGLSAQANVRTETLTRQLHELSERVARLEEKV